MDDIKVGNQYGYWTVLALDDGQHTNKVLCRCICGKTRWVFRSPLRLGKTKSCGCMAHQDPDCGIKPGDHIGYWTVIRQKGQHFYCRCICGRERWVPAAHLLQGRSLSCGCKRLETRTEESAAALEKGHLLTADLGKEKLLSKYAGFGRKGNKNSSTGITGVAVHRSGRYRAYITVDRKQISLGYYDDINDAIAARKAAEQKYFADRQKKANKIISIHNKRHSR